MGALFSFDTKTQESYTFRHYYLLFMPQIAVEHLPKNIVKFTITIPLTELAPFLEDAAMHISQETSIPGFRPGKANYEIVKQRVGEMKIYEEALEPLVRKTYIEALMGEKIEAVGSPKIDVVKLAPGNDLIYTAEVTRMPSVTQMADYKTFTIAPKDIQVVDKEIDLTLKDLSRMQTKEVRAQKDVKTTVKDKVVVSMNMKKDGVAIEGGQSPNHAIYLPEDYYIPGLKDQLIGMTEGEQKTFTLKFPEDHIQKILAGSEIEFEVTINELYHLDSPEIDDAFAQSIGQKDLIGLREVLKHNIAHEKEHEEERRQEKEMLEMIAKKSDFEEIPDLLVNEEINKMLYELQKSVERQGVNFEDYLKNIKRTIADLKLDFTPQALMRIKVAILLRKIAKDLEITVKPEELDQEIDGSAQMYEDNPEIKKHLYSPEYRDYTEYMIRNRKTIQKLREVMVKA
ncbi:TPA: trigger factor [Candidatus Uhrbacteria bacterium]|nr:trigger factor [Candidatus Uhrbacteria bacterium]